MPTHTHSPMFTKTTSQKGNRTSNFSRNLLTVMMKCLDSTPKMSCPLPRLLSTSSDNKAPAASVGQSSCSHSSNQMNPAQIKLYHRLQSPYPLPLFSRPSKHPSNNHHNRWYSPQTIYRDDSSKQLAITRPVRVKEKRFSPPASKTQLIVSCLARASFTFPIQELRGLMSQPCLKFSPTSNLQRLFRTWQNK